MKCDRQILVATVAAGLLLATCPAPAATFAPTDVAGLVAAINAANANEESDTIDLGGQTFMLTAVNNTLNGPNGLPAVLPDGGSTLTIQNGTIERSPAAPSFRLLHVGLGATLALATTTLQAGVLDTSDFGAAVFNRGTLSIVGSTFSDNRAYPGSAGAIENEGELSVVSSVFSGNSSSFAGAIGNYGTLSITGSIFLQNFAEFDGGAIYNGLTISAIRNSTFSANTSRWGGAIFNENLIGSITNTTFAFGSASYAGDRGGGIYNSSNAQILELSSNIVAESMGTAPRDISNAGTIVSASSNVVGIGEGSGLTDGVNGNQVGSLASPLDPLLGPLANNGGPTLTHALLAGSPAIDRGSNPAGLAYDQRGPGFSRVSGAQADAGAYELQSADLSVAKVDTPDPVVPGASVTWTVTVQNDGPDTAMALALSDPLPAGTTFVSLSAPGGWTCTSPAVGTGGIVSCSIASFPVGSAVFTIVAAVDGATPVGTVLSNTATVGSVTPEPDSANNSATATTTVASPALVSATKAVSGSFWSGGSVTYTIVLSNAGPGAQLDNPGDELADTLPAELALVSATTTSGTATATVGTNTVTWNGSIPAGGTVTITIGATVRATTPLGASVSNQATIAYDLDGNGTNEASGVTDDPATTAGGDATVFTALGAGMAAIPTLDGFGLGLLTLLVALGGAILLGRRLS
jgi:uncharacterized repeat protein (TIGR01451 family)